MNKVALIIIYNHQFNRNIDILETIYQDRFTHIYHLVPFYNGDKKNVIPVYESSFYFQGYIAQGFKAFFQEDFTHYFFIADDLIINPLINENNYTDHLHLSTTSCFIPELLTLHQVTEYWWPRVGEAFFWNLKHPGVEAVNQLPDYQEAMQKFRKFDLTVHPLQFFQIYNRPERFKVFVYRILRERNYFTHYINCKLRKASFSLNYPLVGGYADIAVISSKTIKLFCHYCGVFSSTKLHVELALPTAVVLSASEIVTEKDLRLKGKPMWSSEELQELNKYEFSLIKLLKEFPANYLYLHPIKLSMWDTRL